MTRNRSLELAPAAAAALQAGLVDPRVVLVLADLASPRRLAVDDFPVEPLVGVRPRVSVGVRPDVSVPAGRS